MSIEEHAFNQITEIPSSTSLTVKVDKIVVGFAPYIITGKCGRCKQIKEIDCFRRCPCPSIILIVMLNMPEPVLNVWMEECHMDSVLNISKMETDKCTRCHSKNLLKSSG